MRKQNNSGNRPAGTKQNTTSKKPYRSGNQRPDKEKKSGKPKSGSATDMVRLNKYIANAGICSRREADELIKTGLITVNGKIVTELGTKVKPTDDVRYNGGRIKSDKKVYVVMNKPKDYVTTLEDPHAKKIVTDLLRGRVKERIYPVGRLDRMTTGVLLLTNDGELTKRLTHPSYNKKKIYHVSLDKNVSKADLQKMVDGLELDDGFIQADAASYAHPEDKKQVGLELHSGRNRIVRRIFEHLGYKVQKLDRVYFAGLTKKSLRRGQWRLLNDKEIGMLKMNAYE